MYQDSEQYFCNVSPFKDSLQRFVEKKLVVLMAWKSSKMLILLSSCVSHCLPVSSANNSCKLFVPRSDLTISSGLRVQTVCHSVGISERIFFSQKLILKKKTSRRQKARKITQYAFELLTFGRYIRMPQLISDNPILIRRDRIVLLEQRNTVLHFDPSKHTFG